MNKNSLRRIFILLILLLLISIGYLALEYSTYRAGEWQIITSQRMDLTAHSAQIQIPKPEKVVYSEDYWDILRKGRLFFEPEPEKKPEVQVPVPESKPIYNPPPTPVAPKPEKPACTWELRGILLGDQATAVLSNPTEGRSQMVKDGTRLGEYIVSMITAEYVLLTQGEWEYKLELGGN